MSVAADSAGATERELTQIRLPGGYASHVIADGGVVPNLGFPLKAKHAREQPLSAGNLHFDLASACVTQQLSDQLIVCLQYDGSLPAREMALFDAFLTQPGTIHSTTPGGAASARRLLEQARINANVQIDSPSDCPAACGPRSLRITRP